LSSKLTEPQVDDNEIWEPESALDILIALLYAKGKQGNVGESIEGITRLDKLMFLLSRNKYLESIVNKGYNFEADNFGPFAPELFDDIEALKHENVLAVTSSRKPVNRTEVADEDAVLDPLDDADPDDDYLVNCYVLTEEGMQIGKLIWNGLTPEQRTEISRIKSTWQSKSLTELLHFVYRRYPETTEKSKIRDKILINR